MVLSFLFSFDLSFSSFLSYFVRPLSSENHFAFLHFFFLGIVWEWPPVQFLRTTVHSCPSTLSDPISWICHLHSIILRDLIRFYLYCIMVLPTFFNLSLNFTINILCSEPQSAPSLVLLIVQSFCISCCKEYNQSDFGIDHLVMSMCRVISCVVGNGCLLWPMCSLGKTLVSLCPASFCIPRPNLSVTPGISWLPTFAFQSPMIKRISFSWYYL